MHDVRRSRGRLLRELGARYAAIAAQPQGALQASNALASW